MEVRPDEFFRFEHDGTEYFMNAKYDRIDHYLPLGTFVMRILEDDGTVASLFTTPESAEKIVEQTGVPVVPRLWLYQSEYDDYLTAQSKILDDSWLE